MAVCLYYMSEPFLCADLRLETTIMATRYASLACADLLTSHQHQSYYHRLGNEILYNFACDLLGILMMHMTCTCAVCYM